MIVVAGNSAPPAVGGQRERARGVPESPHGFVGVTPPTGLLAQRHIDEWLRSTLAG
jgi:hypothetical protein